MLSSQRLFYPQITRPALAWPLVSAGCRQITQINLKIESVFFFKSGTRLFCGHPRIKDFKDSTQTWFSPTMLSPQRLFYQQITQINSRSSLFFSLNQALVFSAVICGHLRIKDFKDYSPRPPRKQCDIADGVPFVTEMFTLHPSSPSPPRRTPGHSPLLPDQPLPFHRAV